MGPRIKVCGLTEPDRVADAARLGASFVGFIFYPPSARCVRPDVAAALAARVPDGVATVGVVVDADDAQLDAILAEVPLDILQLHGAETPARVLEIGLRTGCRVMKALRVADAADLEPVGAYREVADMLLFDAKPPAAPGMLPGGNGLAFDWRLLQDLRLEGDWALAGGLDTGNLAEAMRLVGPPIVDVSSGVESRPGIKDPVRLAAFMAEAIRLRRGATAAAAATSLRANLEPVDR